MADATVTFLLDSVKQLVQDHYKLISGAENELVQLQGDLEMMKGVLEDAARKAHKDQVFKAWERRIRDVVYEVEDTIDSCVTEAAHPKKLTFTRISLAKEVKRLREGKVKPLFEEATVKLANLSIQDKPADPTVEKTVENTRKPRRQENIVGFEDVTDTMIQCLTEASKALEAISITGMPGLGKTTVAWKIYNHPKIQYEFPTRIWITVSQEFNKRDVLLAILKEFTHEDLSSKNDDELAKRVRHELDRGKFLIVMDDVWSIQVWKDIEDALPEHNGTSKILITSRHEEVARHANRIRDPHLLRFLNPEESWQLLQLEVFGKLNQCPSNLEQVGRLTALRCDGLPLSIVVIGGILFEIYSAGGMVRLASEWDNVSDSVETLLIHGDKHKTMENIISLSYEKLPYELRDCFLYLGMFPEDKEIPTWKLIQLWIAEGFIRQHPGKSLEEIALGNLMDLISRNLVMGEQTKPYGDIYKTIGVHDTIREFCKKQAAKDKLNLFQEIKKSRQGVFEPSLSDIHKHRRLCIHSYVEDFIQKKPKALNTRTFLCFSKSAVVLKTADIQSFTDAFNLLRVLDANTIKFPKFPAKLTQLIHLRYITLCGDGFKLLPDVISKLWNLQTLIVDTTLRELEVNADIWKMVQLRHFKTKASIILKKEGKSTDGGENLQTLSRLSPVSCTENVFQKAKNLTTLGIRGQLETILEANCFEKLHLLKKWKLVYDIHPKAASENPLLRLPEPKKFPPHVRILTLSGTYLEWQHMSTLALIHSLKVLKLKENAFTGASWNVAGGGFRNLEVLHIERTDMVFWRTSGDPFPNLRYLILKNCEKLQEIPEILATTLEMLSVERVTKYAVASARKIEEERKKNRADKGGFKLLIAPGDE